jgi:D-serine deaminase-like pyridoxal phosphate-dependent protein
MPPIPEKPASIAVGLPVSQLDTPALLLDLDSMERNLHTMADFLSAHGLRHRPHVKLYRAIPQLARHQVQAGAIGLTCAKLSEAEVLVRTGFPDILIANQVVGAQKINRLAELARSCDIKVAVDSLENVAALSQGACAHGVTIGILVEVNIGQNRCGVAPFEPALALAQAVVASPGLQFRGIMGYDGHCTFKVTEEERGPLSLKAHKLLVDTRHYIAAAGIPVEIVSGSGSLTYRYAAQVPGMTEVQSGTYLLMDTAYQSHGIHEFECTLSVLSTVISRPAYPGANGLALIDTGKKSMSALLGMPEMKEPAAARVIALSDEHGRVMVDPQAEPVKVGDKIEMWVRDSNGTINQFDRIYAVRSGIVEEVWMIPICGQST